MDGAGPGRPAPADAGGRWRRVDLGASDRVLLEADGRRSAVFRVEGDVHAVDDACPHEGNPRIDGEVLGRRLVCACHAWRFDLESGACLVGDEPVRRYPVATRGGEVWV